MIGNDIVDLEESRRESNWQRRGWLEKVFCTEEQQLVATAPDPDLMVWLLWSMKEAVYKICNKASGSVFYGPQQFAGLPVRCADNHFEGTVRYGAAAYYTRSILYPGFIHTIASSENNYTGIDVYIRKTGTPMTALPEGTFLRKTPAGIPYLFDTVSGRMQEASLSHHGRFEALIFKPSISDV